MAWVTALATVVLIAPLPGQESVRRRYPWAAASPNELTVASRILAPDGFGRIATPTSSFGDWLRNLPLKRGNPDVRLFNGERKANQSGHYAVLDIDVGPRDLQQCADAVIRLRAEYLFASGAEDRIGFHFTNGSLARWSDWMGGLRPVVRDQDVRWKPQAAADSSYRNFRAYLDSVFSYSGTQSLAKELVAVTDGDAIQPGDVFIEGGSPGHAVIVIDVAENRRHERVFLLAQSYMPAQDVHVLVNPQDASVSPWYRTVRGTALRTPEWTFPAGRLRRFGPR